MAISAERIVNMFEEDAKARRRLALVLISDPEVRLAIINATYRDKTKPREAERRDKERNKRVEERDEG